MTAFVVLSRFLSIIYLKCCNFYIGFYIPKFYGNKFITDFFMTVKISTKTIVISNDKTIILGDNSLMY